MKTRKTIIAGLAALAVFFSLSACSSHKPAPRTVPKTSPKPVTTTAPANPQAQEAEKPAPAPGKLPVLGKEDLNGDAQSDKNGEPDKEAAALLEEGFTAYQEALAALNRKDMDAALVKLDEAYEIIPKIKVSPDSALLQEKNDLRILVAQRIQQVYAMGHQADASVRASVYSNNNSLPLVVNQWVKKEIASFQAGEKAWFVEAYKRSGL
ncbi:MAG: hypothetical protein ABFD80_13375, partial [Acidobacteriota bacterium]